MNPWLEIAYATPADAEKALPDRDEREAARRRRWFRTERTEQTLSREIDL